MLGEFPSYCSSYARCYDALPCHMASPLILLATCCYAAAGNCAAVIENSASGDTIMVDMFSILPDGRRDFHARTT